MALGRTPEALLMWLVLRLRTCCRLLPSEIAGWGKRLSIIEWCPLYLSIAACIEACDVVLHQTPCWSPVSQHQLASLVRLIVAIHSGTREVVSRRIFSIGSHVDSRMLLMSRWDIMTSRLCSHSLQQTDSTRQVNSLLLSVYLLFWRLGSPERYTIARVQCLVWWMTEKYWSVVPQFYLPSVLVTGG